jgi:hypothetical protein
MVYSSCNTIVSILPVTGNVAADWLAFLLCIRVASRSNLGPETDYPEDLILLLRQNRTTNSGALVRQPTIPSKRPPLVGEVSANFSG